MWNFFQQASPTVEFDLALLRRENADLRRVFDNSLDLLLIVDARGNFTRVSPSSQALLGYRPEEMVGRNGRDFLHPDDLDSVRHEMRLARRGRVMRQFECSYLHKQGKVVTLQWTGVWSEPEQQHYFIGRDVTEQNLSRELFRIAVNACPTGMMMVDPSGKMILVNDEVEKLFGYSRDELVDKNIAILVPPDLHASHSRLRELFRRNRASRLMRGRQIFALRKDGSEFPAQIDINAVETRDGVLFLAVITDLTERRRAEELKDDFVATVSHELRTPLTAIAAALALIRNGGCGDLPPAAARLIDIACGNAGRLTRLINDILDVEKAESGRMVFHLQPVEMRSLLQSALDSNRWLAAETGVKLRLACEAPAAKVNADPDRLTQVVANLLSNAIKYSPAGEEVLVTLAEGSGHVRIGVRDRGAGIPEKFKPRVFERFAQAEVQGEKRRGGSGLGLCIVKEIIHRLGGEVGFDSSVGHGTLFWFELPSFQEQTTASKLALSIVAPVPAGQTALIGASA